MTIRKKSRTFHEKGDAGIPLKLSLGQSAFNLRMGGYKYEETKLRVVPTKK